ncbi:hypothetical protein HB848_13625 [Listeria rocourtiae]|uniref:hypothetical protein n=1 Tax=Listeria rocourtiae TaxID=647910 RepID=UPI0016249D2A|nr:hypothetical protein [Listeria rocourtiae]MBC1436378.1 hypothetical protein [Listeria rocourtiae]
MTKTAIVELGKLEISFSNREISENVVMPDYKRPELGRLTGHSKPAQSRWLVLKGTVMVAIIEGAFFDDIFKKC